MSSMRDKFVNLLIRQIGVKENPLGSNKTKYGNWFDSTWGAWQYFNTKKNGSAGWCAILQIWAVAQNEILGIAESKKFLGLPAPKKNTAAGCPQFCNFLTQKGYRLSDKTKGIKGDIIFFNTKDSKGKTIVCGHVGSIKKEDSKYYYTIEGNKNNRVGEGKYAKNSSAIYCVCHLPWEKYDPVIPELPADFKVYNLKEFLSLRADASNNATKLGEVYNDAIVTVYEIKDGFGRVTPNMWLNMDYLKQI